MAHGLQVLNKEVLSIIVDILLSPSTSASWHMLAQSAVKALYMIHPNPSSAVFPLLNSLCKQALLPLDRMQRADVAATQDAAADTKHLASRIGLDPMEIDDNTNASLCLLADESALARTGKAVRMDSAEGEARDLVGELCDGVSQLQLPEDCNQTIRPVIKHSALSHLFTVVGQVAMQHLRYLESHLACLRRAEVEASKVANVQVRNDSIMFDLVPGNSVLCNSVLCAWLNQLDLKGKKHVPARTT